MLQKLSKKLLAIIPLLVMWILRGLFESWLFDTILNTLKERGVPMSVLTFLTEYQNYIIPGIAVVGIIIILLLSYRDNEKRRNSELNEHIKKTIFDSKVKQVLGVTSTLTDMDIRHEYWLNHGATKKLTDDETKAVMIKLFGNLNLKAYTHDSQKPIKAVLNEEINKNAKNLGLTTNPNASNFNEKDVAFLMTFYRTLGEEDKGMMPLLKSDGLLDDLKSKLYLGIVNVNSINGAKIYKHVHISIGVNNFLLLYDIVPSKLQDAMTKLLRFNRLGYQDWKIKVLADSIRDIRESLEKELYIYGK